LTSTDARLEQQVCIAAGDDIVHDHDEADDGRVAVAALDVEIDVLAGDRAEGQQRLELVLGPRRRGARVERDRRRGAGLRELEGDAADDHGVERVVDQAADRRPRRRVLDSLAAEHLRRPDEDRFGHRGDL
jgi:hypothetical protein